MSRPIFFLIGISIFLLQCALEPTGHSDDNGEEQNEQGQILFKMSMTGTPAEVASLAGTLSRVNYDPIYFDFEIKGGNASALVENLIAGLWTLQVDAFNKDNVVIYSGKTSVQVNPGTITPVNLHLNPTTGGLEITVTWGYNSFLDSLIVAYYSFENSLSDLSRYQNDGVDHGGLTYAPGVHGQAVQFDGYDDFVEISHSDHLNIQEKTIAFWFYKSNDYIQDTPGWNDVEGLVYKSWDTGLNRDFSFTIRNQDPPFSLITTVWDGTDSLTFLVAENVIHPKEWYFVTLVCGKSETKLYLNAELIYTATNHNDLIQNSAPIILGKVSYKSMYTRFFNGMIDDLAILHKPLNQDEIQKIYQNDLLIL